MVSIEMIVPLGLTDSHFFYRGGLDATNAKKIVDELNENVGIPRFAILHEGD